MDATYIRKQARFYQIASQGDRPAGAKDALWRIASHLEGVVDGIQGVGDELTPEQTEFVLRYLRDEGHLLDHILAEFEKPQIDEPIDDSCIPLFLEFLNG